VKVLDRLHMFEARQLAKHYGPHIALHPLDLTIPEGTSVAILGESGSGKSTLIRLLAGLDAPSAGVVHFQGQPLSHDAQRRGMGYVVQSGGLFPHLTARQNVTLLARHLGWSKSQLSARIDELLSVSHLSPELLSRYPAQLSGGQMQRVALMRALFLDPAVLLLDEPLGALDPVTRHELQEDLRRIFRELKKTYVLVTHDVGEAFYFAERILVVQSGKVLQDGTPRDLWASPATPYVRQFLHAHRCPFEKEWRG
jgi:osmoprotectant transport system ATP-binding protein